MNIYQNARNLSPAEFLKDCADQAGGGRIGYYGKNEFSKAFVKMLKEAGVDVAFQLTWVPECGDSEIPKVAKQEFMPEMADVILLIDSHKGSYWFTDLPALGFQGPILTVEEFLEGKEK